ncbi:hypothetical protein M413DRAFT_444745 [Hebeloma cylindrosporum]|uniref:DUF6533 domain-containing protein n=1 Tax=Hebeloma cylindrosporum TaxID=76867 RepID=A0A0C2YMS7_HEBCY|nr:hypothetical protein M413DRAFT_444745 [Hebeloma cylindrosporum h7]
MFEFASESLPSNSFVFVGQSVVLGTLVLLIYDYLCTFDQEVEYVWSRPSSVGRYLFVLNRYIPITSLILSYLVMKVPMSTAACHRVYTTITWLTVAGVCTAQVILYLRTIALWARNRWILRSLGILAVCTLAPCIVLSKIYTDSLHFGADHPDAPGECLLVHSNPIVFLDYVLLFISETIVVFLTLIRAYKHLRYSNSSWVHQLYERGIIFYFYLLAFTVLNTILSLVAPLSLKTTFSCPQLALHSIFCNRVIFIILSQQRDRDDTDFDTLPYSTEGIMMTSILDTYATRDELLPPRLR